MALLDKLREQYGVRPVCSELHIAPSTYYHCQQQRHHPDKRSAHAQRDDWLKREIQRVYAYRGEAGNRPHAPDKGSYGIHKAPRIGGYDIRRGKAEAGP